MSRTHKKEAKPKELNYFKCHEDTWKGDRKRANKASRADGKEFARDYDEDAAGSNWWFSYLSKWLNESR